MWLGLRYGFPRWILHAVAIMIVAIMQIVFAFTPAGAAFSKVLIQEGISDITFLVTKIMSGEEEQIRLN